MPSASDPLDVHVRGASVARALGVVAPRVMAALVLALLPACRSADAGEGSGDRRGPEPSRFAPGHFDAVEYDEAFDAGLSALDDGRTGDAIAAFERALELEPRNATCAYNLGCAHALAGDAESAFTWLGRAADWGFGLVDGNFAFAQDDPDLARLRGDIRFDLFLARMSSTRAALRERTSQPLLALEPTLSQDSARQPQALIFVLLDVGHTAQQARTGPWPEVAARLDAALVVLPGSVAVGGDEEDGLAWFGEVRDYLTTPSHFDGHVVEQVNGIVESYQWRDVPTVLVGEGQGGLVATHLALTRHELFDGLVVVEAPLFEPIVRRAMALRARADVPLPTAPIQILWTEDPAFLGPNDPERGRYRVDVATMSSELGLEHDFVPLPSWPTWQDPAAVVGVLSEAVRAATVSSPARDRP